MARIFKQTYTKPLPEGAEIFTRKGRRYARFKDSKGKTVTAPLSQDGTRIIRELTKWYIDYVDANGKSRRVPGYTDRKATEQKASELERTAERVRSGYRPKEHDALARPLTEHLSEFKSHLLAKGTGEKQAIQAHNEIKRILNNCGLVFWPDISATRIQGFLAELRRDKAGKTGISARTSNSYLQSIKSFCTWMVREGRAPESPLSHLKGINVKTDRRHDRRALTDAECRDLLETTPIGPVRFNMVGPDRALLYRTALETGLRANELRTLTVGACHLYETPPVLVVKAAYSKHRREDHQPITPGLARILAQYVHGRESHERVFRNMPNSDSTAEMLRKDLEAAGIPYIDSAGLFADFQALRHTYITNLARGGAKPKEAMDLARHSDINLTMARYSHTVISDRAEALKALPDLSTKPERTHSQKATGTDDAVVEKANIEGNTTSSATSSNSKGYNSLAKRNIDKTENGLLISGSKVRVLGGA